MKTERPTFLHQTSLRIPTINRALVLYVTLLAGFWGGHKFLLGAWREGWLYLLLSWTSIPLWASMGDFVDLARQPAVGLGFLKRRLLKRHLADRNVIERATWWQLGRVLFLLLLFMTFSVWFTDRMNRGHERVNRLCEQIKPGTASAEVRAFAAGHDLRIGSIREGFNILSDTATAGRHSCHVTIQNGHVERSEHYFMD